MDITPDTLRNVRDAVAMTKPVDVRRFDYLFPGLQGNPENLLPEAKKTRDGLVALGEAMADAGGDDPTGDSDISAAYTYFGQFVDHDITLEASSAPGSRLVAPDLAPLPLDRIREETQNVLTAGSSAARVRR